MQISGRWRTLTSAVAKAENAAAVLLLVLAKMDLAPALAAAAGNNRNIRQRRLGAAAARRVLVDGAELAIWEAARVRITESAPPEDSLLRLEGELFSETQQLQALANRFVTSYSFVGNLLTTGIVIVVSCWCQVGNRKMPILDPSQ